MAPGDNRSIKLPEDIPSPTSASYPERSFQRAVPRGAALVIFRPGGLPLTGLFPSFWKPVLNRGGCVPIRDHHPPLFMQSIDIELDMARTCFGELTLEQRNRLLAYYEYPNDETWDDVYNLTIMPYGHINTVWQAVCAIDATFPTRGPCVDAFGQRLEPWPRIPEPELFRQALVYATH